MRALFWYADVCIFAADRTMMTTRSTRSVPIPLVSDKSDGVMADTYQRYYIAKELPSDTLVLRLNDKNVVGLSFRELLPDGTSFNEFDVFLPRKLQHPNPSHNGYFSFECKRDHTSHYAMSVQSLTTPQMSRTCVNLSSLEDLQVQFRKPLDRDRPIPFWVHMSDGTVKEYAHPELQSTLVIPDMETYVREVSFHTGDCFGVLGNGFVAMGGASRKSWNKWEVETWNKWPEAKALMVRDPMWDVRESCGLRGDGEDFPVNCRITRLLFCFASGDAKAARSAPVRVTHVNLWRDGEAETGPAVSGALPWVPPGFAECEEDWRAKQSDKGKQFDIRSTPLDESTIVSEILGIFRIFGYFKWMDFDTIHAKLDMTKFPIHAKMDMTQIRKGAEHTFMCLLRYLQSDQTGSNVRLECQLSSAQPRGIWRALPAETNHVLPMPTS